MSEQFKTFHLVSIGDAGSMPEVEDQSIDLIVTSPPYPMIEMWDDQFRHLDPNISRAIDELNGGLAFELMHRQLDVVWDEAFRILKSGGMVCINIGDATRTLDGHFQLFPNHARIITKLLSLGFLQLPTILWRKPTNAPNKFMGSGMLPPTAYVTLEHEFILIFRKGRKRTFQKDQKISRRESAYFWEERNTWFSDIWFDLRGASQHLKGSNKRSGAFPLELPFRLINMFSIYGDTVIDPFMGSGTTMIAAMCSARNSVGYEINEKLQPAILEKIIHVPNISNQIIRDRMKAHYDFVCERSNSKGNPKYVNRPYGFPVMTRQEEDLRFRLIQNIQYQSSLKFKIEYTNLSLDNYSEKDWARKINQNGPQVRHKGRQLKIF